VGTAVTLARRGTLPMPNNSEFTAEYNSVVAEYYDAAYEQVLAGAQDIDFYAKLALERPGAVLELGCGTGRVLLELVRRGVAAVGLDSSRRMLEKLHERAGSQAPPTVCAQMQAFDLAPRRFQFIYSAFRAFQHLYAVEDQLACLHNVFQHLEPGGRFAFDVFKPRLASMLNPSEPEAGDLRFEVEGKEVIRYVTLERQLHRQLIEARMRFETHEADGVVHNEVEVIHMRWFTHFELLHLVARAGFQPVEIYGDFDGSPVRDDSPELVVVATRPA